MMSHSSAGGDGTSDVSRVQSRTLRRRRTISKMKRRVWFTAKRRILV